MKFEDNLEPMANNFFETYPERKMRKEDLEREQLIQAVGEHTLATGLNGTTAVESYLSQNKLSPGILTLRKYHIYVGEFIKRHPETENLFHLIKTLNSSGFNVSEEDYNRIIACTNPSRKEALLKGMIDKYKEQFLQRVNMVGEYRINNCVTQREIFQHFQKSNTPMSLSTIDRYIKRYIELYPEFENLESLIVSALRFQVPIDIDEYKKLANDDNKEGKRSELETFLTIAIEKIKKEIEIYGQYRLDTGATYQQLAESFSTEEKQLTERQMRRHIDRFTEMHPEHSQQLAQINTKNSASVSPKNASK